MIAAGESAPRTPTQAFKAVLLDLDGTLYHQTIVRLGMLAELAAAQVRANPRETGRTIWRTVLAFRRVHEELRFLDNADTPLATTQVERTAAQLGMSTADVQRIVEEWMFSRPLRYMRLARRRGVIPFLEELKSRGVATGVLSDYPVRAKLQTLGLDTHFSVALCTTDPAINRLKPHPRGFLYACEQWGLAPQEVLYIGDRPDVDAAGAAAAGMACAILSRAMTSPVAVEADGSSYTVSSFARLRRALTR